MSEPSAVPPLELAPVLKRGLRKKCPHCGQGDVLDQRGRLRASCDACHYEFERRGGDLFFFLYVGAGAITFVFIVVMYAFRIWSYGWNVRLPYLLLGMAAMVGLMARRMGLAVALDYVTRVLFEDRDAWEPKPRLDAASSRPAEETERPAEPGDPPPTRPSVC